MEDSYKSESIQGNCNKYVYISFGNINLFYSKKLTTTLHFSSARHGEQRVSQFNHHFHENH